VHTTRPPLLVLEAWNKLPTYRPETRFRSFLWAIAAFKCANLRRKHTDVLSEDRVLAEASTERSALARLSDHQRNELLEEAARNVLDATEQEVVHLRWVLDYPYEDIVTLLGFPDKDKVRVTLQRCKHRMEKEVARLMAEKKLTDSFLHSAVD
jgi:RNA polymerase sigma factor (sigma-70 family)